MIFKHGKSCCQPGFSDLQNVAKNCCVIQRYHKFCKDKLYPGTVPLTVENLSTSI
jgi:hypothetical protein